MSVETSNRVIARKTPLSLGKSREAARAGQYIESARRVTPYRNVGFAITVIIILRTKVRSGQSKERRY